MFTDEEIKAAKATRDAIIKDGPSELKSIYMAGEICMWDELNKENSSKSGIEDSLQQIAAQYYLAIAKGDLPQMPFDTSSKIFEWFKIKIAAEIDRLNHIGE